MSESNDTVVIAIDGPSASGKSTVSKRVAEDMDFIYVDSGAFYRGMTWKAVHSGVDVRDSVSLIELMMTSEWNLFLEEKSVRFDFIVDLLRQTRDFGNIVMEGRDIGSVVFPDTSFKFYLDADPEERARRRHREIVEKEGKGEVDAVLQSLQRRDKKDTTRKAAPLQIALGAQVINSTSMSIEEVTAKIVSLIRNVGAE